MELYLAGTSLIKKYLIEYARINELNILESFITMTPEMVKLIPKIRNFMLDSGAFTFMNNNRGHNSIDWDSYADKYAEFILNNNIKYFFELDIDSIVGLKKVERLRRRIEARCGRQSIPVFHTARGKQYYISMCKDYPYVALGGLVSNGIKSRNFARNYFPWFIRTAHENNARIHGLGFTESKYLSKLLFDSVDSTTWTAAARFGIIYKYQSNTIIPIPAGKNRRIINGKEAAWFSFKEWAKYQKQLYS